MAEGRYDYDLIVIGTGPAGVRAAITSAEAGKRTLIVEKRAAVGGLCVNAGTIPSKTIRESVLHLSGWRERHFYGTSYAVKRHITIADLIMRCDQVMRNEIDVLQSQMFRYDVELVHAIASFVDPHTLQLEYVDGSGVRMVTTGHVIVATGTEPTSHESFDGRLVFTSDGVLQLDVLPRTLTIVGAGVIGCEYASIFAALGVRVTLIDMRDRLLPFVDHEIVEALTFHLRANRMTIWLGEKELDSQITPEGHVKTRLESGKHIVADKMLHSVGRTGATAALKLERAGLTPDSRGRLSVNARYQTAVEHIYAAGDVIGFPSLASTSMEQGRLAASHAVGISTDASPAPFPYGIYTLPEISMIGPTEEELTRAGTPYEIGKALYRDVARGQIIGDDVGMLKLMFDPDSHRLLAVHILGEGASELIHIGQAVLSFGGTIDYFVNTVFNYPTLAEAYKLADDDGLNRL